MRRPGSVLFFAIASLALHLAWVVWMPTGRVPARPDPSWVEVTFEQADPPAALSVNSEVADSEAAGEARDPVDPPAREPVEQRARPSATSARVPQSQTGAAARTPTEAPASASAPAPVAATEPPATRPTVQPHLDLSARAAALSLETLETSSPLRCRTAGSDAPSTPECEPSTAAVGANAQAALSEDLRAVAQAVPHLRKRDRPELKRRSDGSYGYQGHVFEAVVRPDGQVDFNDTAVETQLRISLTPVKVIADVNDIVEKEVLHRELYSAEKRWFLEQTQELRDKLAAEYRQLELRRARRALERALQEILDDGTLPVPQKHAAVLALWQDCGEDADARAHRVAVEDFVRRNLPRGTSLGFERDEIVRFNSGRAGLQQFAPYGDSG